MAFDLPTKEQLHATVLKIMESDPEIVLRAMALAARPGFDLAAERAQLHELVDLVCDELPGLVQVVEDVAMRSC